MTDKKIKIKNIAGRIIFILIMAAAAAGVAAMTVNSSVIRNEKDNIAVSISPGHEEVTEKDVAALKKVDPQCVMVLGAGIVDSETPSDMLSDRLDAAVMLYRKGVAKKILLTGDNGTGGHNEIHVMLNYMLDKGIPEEDLFCDHAGFSTYESMYRAKSIFEADRMVVITQTYHLYRALYIAEKMGYRAVGCASDQASYAGQPLREIREVIARNKDFFMVRLKKEAVGGEKIPITGSGVPSHGE